MYTQQELLEVINRYNNANRKDIAINLSTVLKRKGIKNKQIIADTNYSSSKVNSWLAISSPNIPTFEDALMLAVKYDFDINELINN